MSMNFPVFKTEGDLYIKKCNILLLLWVKLCNYFLTNSIPKKAVSLRPFMLSVDDKYRMYSF